MHNKGYVVESVYIELLDILGNHLNCKPLVITEWFELHRRNHKEDSCTIPSRAQYNGWMQYGSTVRQVHLWSEKWGSAEATIGWSWLYFGEDIQNCGDHNPDHPPNHTSTRTRREIYASMQSTYLELFPLQTTHCVHRCTCSLLVEEVMLLQMHQMTAAVELHWSANTQSKSYMHVNTHTYVLSGIARM